MSTPAAIKASTPPWLSLAGPRVAMILVRRTEAVLDHTGDVGVSRAQCPHVPGLGDNDPQ